MEKELKVLPSLSKPGSLWLVGGVVRDALLKRPLSDVDLAVQGDAGRLAAAFARRLRCSAFPLDKERGVYRVVLEQDSARRTFDFAALQGPTIQKDLARRDFTVNAMALPLEIFLSSPTPLVGEIRGGGGLIDPFKGRDDIKKRLLRALGDKSFTEDPLRLLRAARLSAELDFSVDPKTAALMRRRAGLIRKSAPERVREELLKTLATPRAAEAFRLLDRTGVLSVLVPEAEDMRRSGHAYYGKQGVLGHSLDAMAAFEKLMERLELLFPGFHKHLRAHLTEPLSGHPRFALLKLGELFHDAGKPATEKKEKDGRVHFYGHEHVGARIAEKAASRWRLSGEESRSLTRLVQGHMRPGNLGNAPELTDRAVYRFYRDMEGDSVGLLVMALADHFTYLSDKVQRSRKDPVFRAIHRMLETYFLRREAVAPPKLVDGHALMKRLKLKPGPVIGDLLDAIREGQAAGKVKTADDAFSLAGRFLKKAS